LPPAFLNASFEPLPPFQGDTVVVKVNAQPGYSISGRLGDYELHFFPWKEQSWVALQGLHAMLEPGVYPLHLEARSGSDVQLLEQGVLIRDAGYPDDPIIYVKDQTTIDPAVMDAEWQQVLQIVAPVTPDRLWDGVFQSPAALFPDPNCFTSRFGNRREYRAQNSEQAVLYSFHSGLDFCGGSGLSIVAPANGKVVFSGLLAVRGNATFIDHGWGVYSGYFHQAVTYVKAGDMVAPGQVIGAVGDTGRVTGAHLHWEIWVNGVQVNPLRWLEKRFP
ncbi:MAG: M23 family metallopeptidase, partial [Anaerolineales bacterium]